MASYPKNFSFYTVPVSTSGTLTGNFSTLLGSAGSTLVAAGKSDVLNAGSGPSTLIGSSLAGVSTTLIGNGTSSLSGGRGNDLFQIPFAGDSIGGSAGGNDTLSSPINAIDLNDTLSYGTGIAAVANAVYTGLGGATLVGNGLKGSLLGGRSGGNSLVSGTASQTLVGGNPLAGGNDADTLIGNGRSFLIGGNGNNVYVVNAAGDTIVQPSGTGTSSVRTSLNGFNLTDTLHYGSGILNVKQLFFTNDTLTTGTISLTGNTLDNTIVGSANAKNILSAGRGSKASLVAGTANDTLIGNGFSTLNGGSGTNLYYVSGSSGGKSDLIINAGVGSSVIGLPQGNTPFSYDLTTANSSLLPGGVTRLNYTGAAYATLVGNTLLGNTVADTLSGGSGINFLIAGSAGSSMVGGNKGNFFSDSLASPFVVSTMQGGGGNDTYSVSNLSDQIVEPAGPYGGTDVVWTTLPSFDLSATNVAGGVGVDNLTYFGAGNATLLGNSLNNSLDATSSTIASAGITLNGGVGFDTLLGSTVSPNFFVVSDPKYLGSNFKISGGLSTFGDTLSISSPSTLTDSIFGSKGFQFIQNVESLLLTSSSSATLGSNAAASRISRVILGAGPDTVDASGYNTLIGSTLPDITLDATADLVAGDLLKGSSQNGSAFLFTSPVALQASTLNGSSLAVSLAADTLAFVSTSIPLTLGDGNFTANITGVDELSVPGGSFVTLGVNAQTSQVSTIAAGSGNSTLSAAGYTSSVTIDVSAGVTDSDSLVGSSVAGTRFVISSPTVLSGSTIQGGAAIDTLSITTPLVGFNDSIPATDVSIEVLQLASSSDVTIGSNFQAAGIVNVVAGAGPDSINAAGYTTSLTLDASANTGNADMLVGSSTAGTSFLFSTASAVSQSTVTGGTGADTLQLISPVTLADVSFNPSITQIDVLALSGASSVTLDSNAASTGIVSVLGGSGNSSLTQGPGNTLALTLSGGSGNDLISIATTSQLAADSVYGNGGSDTLQITSASTSVTDSVFSRTAAVGTLRLTSPSAATLGGSAQAAGIRSVVLGSGSDSVDASAYTAGVTLDATAATTNGDTLLGSGTASTAFLFSASTALASSSVKGGTASDTLALSGASTLPDSVFGKASFVDVLVSSGSSSITLDSLAALSGINTVLLGDTLAGNTLTYNSTLIQTANNTLAGAVPVPLTVIGGSGNDSILVNSASLLASDSILGGTGSDTLALGTAATLDDSLFGRLSGIEALSLSGASSLSLGSLVSGAGLKAFYTTGNSTLTETPLYSASATIAGGVGNDLVQLTTRARLIADSISGGTGIDTLQLTSPATLADADFTSLSGVERLQLTSSSRAVLGSVARGAGINYIYTGTGSDTINASAMSSAITINATADSSSPLNLAGSGTAASTFLLAGGNVLGLSTITGGTGVDTVSISLASTLSDASFSNLTKIDALSLSGASAVTLSNKAQSAGITSVTFGSTLSSDNSTLTQLSNDTLAVTITGGAGRDFFNIANATVLQGDSLVGGAGSDTLYLASASTLSNAFAKVSGIEVLSLTGASRVILGTSGQTAGIATVIGGTASNLIDASAFTTAITINDSASTVASALFGGTAADSISGGSGIDTLRGYSGAASLNSASDTLRGGSGADLFIMAATGDTNNAYGRGASNTAYVTDFTSGAGGDKIQLHQFGASSADYSTLLSGSNLSIYHTSTQTPANLVAVLTQTGTFNWASNSTFI
jgi:Ca2+-binding RTX toxin-like protein